MTFSPQESFSPFIITSTFLLFVLLYKLVAFIWMNRSSLNHPRLSCFKNGRGSQIKHLSIKSMGQPSDPGFNPGISSEIQRSNCFPLGTLKEKKAKVTFTQRGSPKHPISQNKSSYTKHRLVITKEIQMGLGWCQNPALIPHSLRKTVIVERIDSRPNCWD